MRFVLLMFLAVPLSAAPVTFANDIAPIVYQHCAPCHHAGGSGPFPLITYSDVKKHASQIAIVTQRRYMPPWPAERGYGDFADDRSLSDAQIRTIADWVAAKAPEGSKDQAPAPPVFSGEWQLGPPDLILKMRQPFRMPAASSDVFRNFVLPSGVNRTRFVRALELRVDNPRVVHHANIVLDRTESLRSRDGRDGQPGFPGMDVITEAAPNDFEPDSHFLFWKPASVLRPEPDDLSWRLDPDTDLIVNLHLQPTGKEESVQVEIGIYFSPKPPTRLPMLVQLEHDGALKIPPGTNNFSVSDSLTLPVDADLLAIYPHAHYLGKLIEAWAVLPDGSKKWLIRIPDWDINWQAVYNYRTPIFLPEGTKVTMRITYDNTNANPRNPNRPPKLVVTGDRAQDEMGHVWLQLLPRSVPGEDGRLPLQEAVMRRRLEKYPADFVAHYNLGALMQYEGRLDDAAANYKDALKIEPQNPTARNSLAAVLLAENKFADAIEGFRQVLRLDPSYMNARYNLARALAASGDLEGAASEYAAFVSAKPDDAAAQAGFGTVLFHERQFGPALDHFKLAVHLDPSNADVQANYGTLLAITGDLHSAEQAFEAALQINPEHEAARANLARVRQQLARQ
jgi:Flp pilus assembly protein TadD/cytochrome c553